MHGPAGVVDDSQMGQAVFAFEEHMEILKGLEFDQHDVGAGGNLFLPVGASGIGDRR